MAGSLKPHFWDKRFGGDKFIYGEQPNEYLKEKLSELKVGTIPFPCDGEGRNSIYAASIGWKVDAFDMSTSGKKKTMLLAEKSCVQLNYSVCMLEDFEPEIKYYAMALIYAHFRKESGRGYHQKLSQFLKSGRISRKNT